MEKTVRRILKGSNIKMEGRLQLGVMYAGAGPQKANRTASQPVVSIIKKHPEFVVIELTCPCGAKTYLKCVYGADNASAEDFPKQDDNFGAPGEVPKPK